MIPIPASRFQPPGGSMAIRAVVFDVGAPILTHVTQTSSLGGL